MIKINNPFKMENISQATQRLNERFPKVYVGIAVTITLLGYAALFLFPLLLLSALLKVTSGISTAASFMDWFTVFVWMLVGCAAFMISFSLARLKINMPSGLGMKEDKAPHLYQLISELNEKYKSVKINRVIIHDQFSLEIIQIPRFGIPLLTTNVLYIGLPVLQCMSPTQFRGILAGKLGQYSAEHNKLTHWIYTWRKLSAIYARSLSKQKSPLHLPLRMFFRLYTPLLNALTVKIAHSDELEADSYSLNLLNDSDMADVIIRYEVCRYFLKTKYWPKIFSMLRKNPASPECTPHISMAKVVRNALNDNEIAQTVKHLMNSDTESLDPLPDIYTRLENIGQSKLRIPPPVMESAAQRYLGNAFGAVLKLLDKQWLAKYARAPLKKNNNEPQDMDGDPGDSVDVQRLKELRKKARANKLASYEALEMADLTERLEGKLAALVLYQRILQQDPNHPETLFALGRIMITQNDQSGVNLLERAMHLNSGCIAQACWMLAKYFKATGDDIRSRKYLERAASVSAAA